MVEVLLGLLAFIMFLAAWCCCGFGGIGRIQGFGVGFCGVGGCGCYI